MRPGQWGHGGITLVVTDCDNYLMALANVFSLSATELQTGEIAYLVEDQYQGLGIGKILLGQDWVPVPAPEFGHSINVFEKVKTF
jgi:hypothetical protein